MNWVWVLFSLNGRISREPFIAFAAFALAIVIVPGMMMYDEPYREGETYRLVVGFALFWPSIAVQAKRWHDLGKSAWWILVNLIPAGGLVALIILACAPGTSGANPYGTQANKRPAEADGDCDPLE